MMVEKIREEKFVQFLFTKQNTSKKKKIEIKVVKACVCNLMMKKKWFFKIIVFQYNLFPSQWI